MLKINTEAHCIRLHKRGMSSGWSECMNGPYSIGTNAKEEKRATTTAAKATAAAAAAVIATTTSIITNNRTIIEVLKRLSARYYHRIVIVAVIIITQLNENVSDVIQHLHTDDLGVSIDNVSLASIINQALSSLSTTAATTTDNATDERDVPQIPAYIRTTSMVFCITIMLLGVIGNLMVWTITILMELLWEFCCLFLRVLVAWTTDGCVRETA